MNKINFKQLGWYWLSRTTSRGIPLASVAFIYGFFEETQEERVQMTGMTTLVLAIIAIFFYQDIKEKVQNAVEGIWTDMVVEAKWLMVILLLLAFIQWAKTGIGNLETLLMVVGGSQLLALYPSIVHRKYVRLNTKKELKNVSHL